MNFQSKQYLANKLYFTVEDLAELTGVQPASARVKCNRYVRTGEFLRLKNNFYVLAQNWPTYSTKQFLILANNLQVPSYISFMTALAYYGVTTQVQREFFESAAVKRTREFQVQGTEFKYYKISQKFYFDFSRKREVFIASPEKALVDTVYLSFFSSYSYDRDSLDLKKLDQKRIKKILKVYPPRFQEKVKKLCKIS